MRRSKGALLAVGVAVVAAALTWFGNRARYADADVVRFQQRLLAIPNVTRASVSNNGYFLTEPASAILELSGHRYIRLCCVSDELFERRTKLGIEAIGLWQLWLRVTDSSGLRKFMTDVPAGPGGVADTLLGVQIDNITQVIDQYDRVATTVDQWPTEPDMRCVAISGEEVCYWKARRDWLYPAEWSVARSMPSGSSQSRVPQ
jgi:hypothetical protein